MSYASVHPADLANDKVQHDCDYCHASPATEIEDGNITWNIFLCDNCLAKTRKVNHNQFHLDMMYERPKDHLRNCGCKAACPLCMVAKERAR